jgi:hypothetical protein
MKFNSRYGGLFILFSFDITFIFETQNYMIIKTNLKGSQNQVASVYFNLIINSVNKVIIKTPHNNILQEI